MPQFQAGGEMKRWIHESHCCFGYEKPDLRIELKLLSLGLRVGQGSMNNQITLLVLGKETRDE
jgi:hypothetical protein